MALGPDTPDNIVFVPEATMESTGGDIEQIRQRASAEVSVAEGRIAEMDQPGKDSDAGTALSIVGQALMAGATPGAGFKEVMSVFEFIDARAGDKAGMTSGVPEVGSARASGTAQSIDKNIISTTTRAPGLYREEANPAVYGGGGMKGVPLFERIGLAAMSLRKPDSAGLIRPRGSDEGGNMNVDQKKIPSVQSAKDMLYQNVMAHKKAYESTIRVAATRDATIGMAYSMAPGLGNLAPRPTSRILADARQHSEDEGRAQA